MNNVISLIITVVSIIIGKSSFALQKGSGLIWGIPLAVAGLILAQSTYIINEWERIVKLRLGRFQGIHETGSSFHYTRL